jgi:hypothetical protein
VSLGRLPWFPIVVVLLAVAAIAWFQSQAELEHNLKAWKTTAVVLLAILLNLLWFLFTPRFTRSTRLIGLLVLIGLGFGLRKTLRVDGTINGMGLHAIARPQGLHTCSGGKVARVIAADDFKPAAGKPLMNYPS